MLARIRFGEVPTLVASRADPPAAERGTVLLYHPLGEDKSLHEDDLVRLAGSGPQSGAAQMHAAATNRRSASAAP